MKERYDIEGMRIKVAGRTGIRRSNMRKLTRNAMYGNLFGPKHYN
jgi:hypothetical protein